MTARMVCGITGRLEVVYEQNGRWLCAGCGNRVRRPVGAGLYRPPPLGGRF